MVRPLYDFESQNIMVNLRAIVQVQLNNHGSRTMVQNYGYRFTMVQP